jgi:DNA-binding NarL/FixJ family response regulator
VSTHVEHILAKLSVGSRTAAVSIALQHGLFLPNQKYVF